MHSIVLAKRDFKEHDQMISFFSFDRGKIVALAKASKKMQSKNAAHLEPCTLVNAEVVPGKEYSYLTTAQTIELFPAIRQSLEKSLMASFVVQFLDQVTQEGESDPALFRLLWSFLSFVEKETVVKMIVLDAFMIKAFDCFGFRPMLDQCVVSGVLFSEVVKQELANSSPNTAPKSGFYFAGGGFIAPEARQQKEALGEVIYSCGLKEISNLQMLVSADWSMLQNYVIDEGEEQALHRLVYESIIFQSEKKIVDWSKLAFFS